MPLPWIQSFHDVAKVLLYDIMDKASLSLVPLTFSYSDHGHWSPMSKLSHEPCLSQTVLLWSCLDWYFCY